jgi:predicted anti-sigma-YlaC factor YlaD
MSARETLHLTDEQLDDYVDGAMSDAQRASAEAHLASCERCRHAIDATRALLATATRERSAITAPPDLWPLVASSTIHLAAVRRQVLASMRGVLLAGALALAAATAVITWKIARWTAEPDVVVPSTVAPRSGVPSPGHAGHAGHAGHPVAPEAPVPPKAPVPPRP